MHYSALGPSPEHLKEKEREEKAKLAGGLARFWGAKEEKTSRVGSGRTEDLEERG